jgi:hypothetical protein
VSKAKPDGTTLVLLNTPGHLGSALAGSPGVKYSPQAFSYIARLSSEPDVVLGDHHPGVAVPDEHDLAKVFVLQHVRNILDVDVEPDARLQ